MQVHARGKQVPRQGNSVWPEDALLNETAELTINYSGAELANLLNEAAILMVCSCHPQPSCLSLSTLSTSLLIILCKVQSAQYSEF